MFETQTFARLYKKDPVRTVNHICEAIQAHAYKPHDFSIRQLFEAFISDGREIIESWNPRSGGGQNGVQLSRLIEAGAVDTSAFANITGQITFTMLLDAFNDPALIGQSLVTTMPSQFSGEKIPGIGRIGDEAEEIEEMAEYPLAGLNEDWIETPETVKRGFIIGLSKEAIFFDRTGILMQRAGEVSTWLAVNKEKRILDTVLGMTDSYKRKNKSVVATYGDSSGDHDWDNLAATNALADWTDIENAILLFDAMTDPNTGEPIIVNANTIIVPSALKFTAARILNATEIRVGDITTGTGTQTISGNPISGTGLSIVSSQYVKARTTSASTWFIGEPKRAFSYIENFPPKAETAPPNSEAEFTRDIAMRWKISERGVAAVMEPRRMVKCTA